MVFAIMGWDKYFSSMLPKMIEWFLENDYDMNEWLEILEIFRKSSNLMALFCEAASKKDRKKYGKNPPEAFC